MMGIIGIYRQLIFSEGEPLVNPLSCFPGGSCFSLYNKCEFAFAEIEPEGSKASKTD